MIKKSFDAFSALTEKRFIKTFEGVLSLQELVARREAMTDHYSKVMNVEAKLMIDMFRTQLLPAALKYQRQLCKTIERVQNCGVNPNEQVALLKRLSKTIDEAMKKVNILETSREKAFSHDWEERGRAFSEDIDPQCRSLRKSVDDLESLVADHLWPLPKYRELLNIS